MVRAGVSVVCAGVSVACAGAIAVSVVRGDLCLWQSVCTSIHTLALTSIRARSLTESLNLLNPWAPVQFITSQVPKTMYVVLKK